MHQQEVLQHNHNIRRKQEKRERERENADTGRRDDANFQDKYLPETAPDSPYKTLSACDSFVTMITSTSASTKLNVLYVEFNLDEKITINMNQQMYPSLMASTENGKG